MHPPKMYSHFTVTAKEWKLENKQPVGIGSLTLNVKGTIETGQTFFYPVELLLHSDGSHPKFSSMQAWDPSLEENHHPRRNLYPVQE
jgi:hypothetical protein